MPIHAAMLRSFIIGDYESKCNGEKHSAVAAYVCALRIHAIAGSCMNRDVRCSCRSTHVARNLNNRCKCNGIMDAVNGLVNAQCTFVHIAHTTIGVRINAFFAHGNYLVSTNYCSTYILAADAQKKLMHIVRNVQAASSIENYVVRISLRQRKGKALTMLQQISQFFIHSFGTGCEWSYVPNCNGRV